MGLSIPGIGRMCFVISKLDSLLTSPVFRYVDQMTIKDVHNNLEARVVFQQIPETSALSKFFGSAPSLPVEYNRVDIRIYHSDSQLEISNGSGNWVRYVQFDGQLYWEQSQPVPKLTYEPIETSLPSCSLRRPELELIRQNEYEKADR